MRAKRSREKSHGDHPNGDGHPSGEFTIPADGEPVGVSANGHSGGHPQTKTHAGH